MRILSLVITKIVNETSEASTYFISNANGAPIHYTAGQFITLLVEIDGREIRRSYSFGSAPGIDPVTFITIKRVENGQVSRHLLKTLKVGATIKALAPSGRFTVETNNDNFMFIAAGSGVVPVFSLVKSLLHASASTVTLLYQNRNELSSIYRKQLLQLQQHFAARFKLIEFFSQPFDAEHRPARLNNFLLQTIIEKEAINDQQFYLCGPPDFMRMAEFTLKVMGKNDDQIRKENFVVGFVPKAPLISEQPPKNVFIHYNNQTYTLRVAYPHNILEVALNNGIQLPYSCRGGRCSTCTARCVKGKVVMSINEVLTEKDLQKGFVLTCVGYPETDVELTFDE